MKKTLALMALIMTISFSVGAQEAGNDVCPAVKITEKEGTVIVCRDLNSFSAKELDAFEKNDDEIVSFCEMTREICLRKAVK